MKLISTITFVVLHLLAIEAKSQKLTNLIPNPGFEEKKTCPEQFTTPDSPIPISNWFSPTSGTPDLFAAGCGEVVGVPVNWAGTAYAAEGDNYIGLYVDNGKYREYLSVELLDSLQKGVEYDLFFFLKPASNSRFVLDSATFTFTPQLLSALHDSCLSVKNFKATFIEGTGLQSPSVWSYVDVKYIARGGEKFFTIGNFKPTSGIELPKLHDGDSKNNMIGNSAYYYFDYFSISSPEHKQELTAFPINEFFVLDSIFFDFDTYALSEAGKKELVKLSSHLKNHPKLKVLIRGHADEKGSIEYNLKLSANRANAVRNFLVSSGINESRLTVQAFGESESKHKDDMDRRVEFRIVSE